MLYKTFSWVLLVMVLAQSCTVQKRRYMKGFHVQRIFSFPQKTGPSQPEETFVQEKEKLQGTVQRIAEKDSLPVEMVTETREELGQPQTIKTSIQPAAKKEIQKIKSPPVFISRPQPERVSPAAGSSFSGSVPVASQFDGWGLVIFLLIAMGLIFPPLLNVLIDHPLLIILNILVWAAVVVLIVLNIASVGWIIALIFLWHIIHFVLFMMIYNP